MKNFLFTLLFLFIYPKAFSQTDTLQIIVEGRQNDKNQQEKPYVILLSFDGFRHDYAELHEAKNLLKLTENGVRASALVPAFPSKTFPNHYSIVTGLYPAQHGIVDNKFYDSGRKEFYSYRNRKTVEDSSWYGGKPLWVLAEQHKLLTACFYWVGSEAPVQGVFPTYYYKYSEKIPVDERIKTVKNWLNLPEEKRPHLISMYFPEVDHASHAHGPTSSETKSAVQFLDETVQRLVEAVKTTNLDVNFIIVSDHGMTEVDSENTLSLPSKIDTSKFIISSSEALLELHAKDNKNIKKTYKKLKKAEEGYSVYLKSNTPTHLKYSKEFDRYDRVGDIILMSKWPQVFNLSGRKVLNGVHGFDPKGVPDMNGIFYAWGPAFKSKKTLPSVEVVEVYPLVAHILGLPFEHDVAGKDWLIEEILLD